MPVNIVVKLPGEGHCCAGGDAVKMPGSCLMCLSSCPDVPVLLSCPSRGLVSTLTFVLISITQHCPALLECTKTLDTIGPIYYLFPVGT